uniref:Uncharacterized protein n=1 Tax=Hyaloperonospora arabidopsidis (strain Emoy2) TaxID=559515 RepID=M4BC13_HYAAE
MLTHPPRLLLRIRLLANAVMICTVVMTTLVYKDLRCTMQEALDGMCCFYSLNTSLGYYQKGL